MERRTTRANGPDGDLPDCPKEHRMTSDSEGPDPKTPDLPGALARKNDSASQMPDTFDLLAALARTHDGGSHSFQPAALPPANVRWEAGRETPEFAPEAPEAPAREPQQPDRPHNPTSHGKAAAPSFHQRPVQDDGPLLTPWPVIFGGSAVLAAGLAALLWVRPTEHQAQPRTEVVTPAPHVAERPGPSAVQTEATAEVVQRAMSECDQDAGKDPFSLHFLITPIVATSDVSQSVELAGEDYESYFLAASESVLAGLRNKTLTVNATSYRFAIIDSATGKTQIWSAASGLSKFTHSDALVFSKFRVGFDVPNKGLQWSNEYARRAGVCYWVNARFRWK
jgi:hypothetical protein